MEENVSLFEVNDDGFIIYNPVESLEDGGEVQNGDVLNEDFSQGIDMSGEVESSEVLEAQEEVVFYSLGDGDAVPVLLSDEVTQAIIDSMTPAGGSLGSTTLEYFDRVVSSLPSDYKYVAYRTSTDSSYDGVLYYGDDYHIDDGCISFGDDAKQIYVQRVSQSGYNNITEYESYDASNVDVYFSQSGDVIYYTNAEVGYPVLGNLPKTIGISSLLVVGLISSMAVVILQKIFLKR